MDYTADASFRQFFPEALDVVIFGRPDMAVLGPILLYLLQSDYRIRIALHCHPAATAPRSDKRRFFSRLPMVQNCTGFQEVCDSRNV